MKFSVRGLVLYSVLLLVFAVVMGCKSIPKTYQKAQYQAENQNPIIQAWVLTELDEFSALAIELTACFSAKDSNQTAPEILIELGLQGDVKQVVFSNLSNANDCLTQALKDKKLPQPPVVPAWVPFQFNIQKPQQPKDLDPIIKNIKS